MKNTTLSILIGIVVGVLILGGLFYFMQRNQVPSSVLDDENEFVSPIEQQAKVELTASLNDGFVPVDFTVGAGQTVVVSLFSGDGETYVMRFRDQRLRAFVLGAREGDPIRSMSFKAPYGAGRYEFYSSSEGHEDLGLIGEMIVE